MLLVYLPLWGLCIQSKPALKERRAFLLLSPDVNDKVSCGFGWLFDMDFKRGKTSQPERLICNGDFSLLLLSFAASQSKKTVESVKRVTSLFSCNDFRKLEVCSVLFLRQFDLVGVRARPLSPSLTHALLKTWARIRHSQVITCQKELIQTVCEKKSVRFYLHLEEEGKKRGVKLTQSQIPRKLAGCRLQPHAGE